MATGTDVRWIQDEPSKGFRPGVGVEFKVDGKLLRHGVKYKPGQKEQAKQTLIAWAAERGVDLNEAQAGQ